MESTYNTSLIYSDRRAEIRFYPTVRRQGFHSLSYGTRTNKIVSRCSSNQRAKKKLINLVYQNFDDSDTVFVTLTFKENLINLDVANRTFYSFIRKIRYRVGSLKYISVIEFQKRGAVHYHMLLSCRERLDFYMFLKKWRDSIKRNNDIKVKGGTIRIETLTNLELTVKYLTKYLTKSIGNIRLCGKKAYLSSHNLVLPENQRFMLKSDDLLREMFTRFPDLKRFSKIERSVYKDKLTGKMIEYIVLK